MEEIIYLDQNGIDDYKKSIDNLYVNLGRLEERIVILREKKDLSDEYEYLLKLRNSIKKRILEKEQKLKKIVLCEKDDNSLFADVGDILKVNIYYEEEPEEEIFELVSGDSDFDLTIPKISIDSPIGHAIYKTNIGESNYFGIDNEKIKVEVLEKVNQKKLVK